MQVGAEHASAYQVLGQAKQWKSILTSLPDHGAIRASLISAYSFGTFRSSYLPPRQNAEPGNYILQLNELLHDYYHAAEI